MDRLFTQTGSSIPSTSTSSRSNNATIPPSTQTRSRSRTTRPVVTGPSQQTGQDVPLISASASSRTSASSNTRSTTDHARPTRSSLTSASVVSIPSPSTATPITTTSSTTSTRSSSRKPFSPLPLSLFPCKFDLHPSFPLRSSPSGSTSSSALPGSLTSRRKSRPVDPIVTGTEASTASSKKGSKKGKKVDVQTSTVTQSACGESLDSVSQIDMSPITPTTHLSASTRSAGKTSKSSNLSTREGRGKKLGEIVTSFRRHDHGVSALSSSSSSGALTREKQKEEEREMRIVSKVLEGGSGDDLFSSGSERMDQDSFLAGVREAKVDKDERLDDDEDEAWETRSPARRLFVGYETAGSPSLRKPVAKSKLSMMMMDDETSPLRASGSASTSSARPTLRPAPRLVTEKKSSNGPVATAIAIEKRTWTGRDSPSASPIMSKKFRGTKSSIGLASVGDADVDMRIANFDDEPEEEGDKTIVPHDDGNADVHATGFELWHDDSGSHTGMSKRGPGYFDLDLELALSGNPVGSQSSVRPPPAPKYTAENIRMVGKNKVPFPTSGTTTVGDDKGQENIPPPGWLEMLTGLGGEDKLKCRPDTQVFDDKFDLLSSPRRGTPSSASYGDPSGSSLASTPATDRVRKMSSFSSASPGTMRGQPAPSPSLPVSPVPVSSSTSVSEASPVARSRLGSGMKRSLTKSLADLRDAAGLGSGRVLRSGRGRDL